MSCYIVEDILSLILCNSILNRIYYLLFFARPNFRKIVFHICYEYAVYDSYYILSCVISFYAITIFAIVSNLHTTPPYLYYIIEFPMILSSMQNVIMKDKI